MIRVLALDVDGVLTDGRVTLDETGRELKTVSFRDIDAVFHAHRQGLQMALVTGEATPWVDMIAHRLDISYVYRGAKDKVEALRSLCADIGATLDQVCYVGDSRRDAAALALVGLGLAPADASPAAREAAQSVLEHCGGDGAVAEAVDIALQAALVPSDAKLARPNHERDRELHFPGSPRPLTLDPRPSHTPVIGIVQGRLSPPARERLQAFPWSSWPQEFERARSLGFDCIEWLFEAEGFEENPLWTDEGTRHIRHFAQVSKVAIRSVCADYFMAHPFFRVSLEERASSIAVLRRLIQQAAEVGAEVILVPILEVSEIRTEEEADILVDALNACLPLAHAHGVRLGLETELPADRYAALVARFGDPQIGAYYDIGNAAALGRDLAQDVLTLGGGICGAHVKDRPLGGSSVLLGQGNADFTACFAALARVGYHGPLILQTAFGDDYLGLAAAHLEFVKNRYAPVPDQSPTRGAAI
ncbi:MAG: TIM barrel protein [Chloroflexi bacterium]|nr:TIM barrel protein [Chloroflexota bacterium]